MFISFLISFAINILIGEIQGRRNKPQGAVAESINSPTATEDRPLPYGVGTFKVAGNVVWSGDYVAKSVTEKVKTSMLSSKNVAVGHEYHVGLWMTLCGATCANVLEVRYGEELAWSGEHDLGTGSSELRFSHRSREAGEKVDRGIAGTLRFFNSSPLSAAIRNAYVEGRVGEEVPRYPGILHAVFVGPSDGETSTGSIWGGKKFSNGFVGGSASVQPLALTLQRFPDTSDALPGGRTLTWPVAGSLNDAPVRAAVNAWLESVKSIEGDANPALVLLELLTSRIPGLGPCLNPWCIDVESFLRAAETLHAEGVGISAAWESSAELADILTSICTVAQAAPFYNPRTGRISLHLIRNTDAPVATFNDSNVLRLTSFERKAPEELPNVIELPFQDRANSWADRVAQAKNPAGVKTAGTTIVETVEVKGVIRAALALKLANRELRARCAPLATVAFEAVVEPDTVLQVGHLIELDHGPLKQHLRLRVTSARFGSLANAQTVTIEAMEDVFRPGFDGGALTPLPEPVDPEAPKPGVSAGGIMLAPYALSGEEADIPLFYTLPTASPDRYRIAAQLATAWSDDNEVEYGASDAAPAIAGTLYAAVQATVLGGLSLRLDDVNLAAATGGLPDSALVLLGDELLHVDSFVVDKATKLMSMQIRARGVYDTSPAPAALGAYAVVLTSYDVFPCALRTDAAAGAPAIVLRAESRGELVAASEKGYAYAPNKSPARAPLPLPPGAVYMLLGSKPAHSEDTATLSIPRSSGVTVGWKNRNRDLRAITNYSDERDMPAPGARVCCRVGWKANNGTWAENDVARAAVGAATTTVSTTNVPAGERIGRLRIWTENSAGIAGKEHVLYFKFPA
ncbi:phage tail protein [Comamonas terrigena]|uniref:phage tail protein n=1 Tax=Comamonas terrigena TaxID=32013 RepID=UPI00289FEB77|nr:phage tail protein [Comamonas terrigena]